MIESFYTFPYLLRRRILIFRRYCKSFGGKANITLESRDIRVAVSASDTQEILSVDLLEEFPLSLVSITINWATSDFR